MNKFAAKYKFVKLPDTNNPFDSTSIVMRTDIDVLPGLLAEFECFLRACGYNPKGTLQFVEDDENND